MDISAYTDVADFRHLRAGQADIYCTIILPVVGQQGRLSAYLQQLSKMHLPSNYELIAVGHPGLRIETETIGPVLPMLRVVNIDRPLNYHHLIDEAARSARGIFLLIVRKAQPFDLATLQESIRELENSQAKVSFSARSNFILVERSFYAAIGGYCALLKAFESMSWGHEMENQALEAGTATGIDELLFGSLALRKLLSQYKFHTVLDIGCGSGTHTKIFRRHGKKVTTIDLNPGIEDAIAADYNSYIFEPHDCVWCCHLLEHQPNVGMFLKKIHRELKEGGILAVTVPPMKHDVVRGHLTVWNAGLLMLMYNLVLAGFDCRDVAIKKYGYNISAILRKRTVVPPGNLNYDKGDLEKLADYFPLELRQG